MLGAVVTILAQHGYLPESYSDETVLEQLEKLMDDATENPEKLLSAIEAINRVMGLDIAVVNTQVEPEYSGPYCSRLGLNLESRCELKRCPYWTTAHRWNCQKLGDPRQELPSADVSNAVRSVTSKVDLAITFQLPPKRIYCQSAAYCVRCGSQEKLTKTATCYAHCARCLSSMPGKAVQANLEVRFGIPTKELLEHVIKQWHSIPEQSQALGITPLEAQEIFDVFCINPKRYKTADDRRFVNPFYTRMRGRPVIDGYLYRLYAQYAVTRKNSELRPAVKALNSFLLQQANEFLVVRELMTFNIVQASF